MKGYVQVYTGDGKGKTTASFGLALRAAGAGFKVFIAQFVKGQHYSEIDSFKKYSDQITLKQYGLESFIINEPTQEQIDAARVGYDEVKEIIKAGKHQLVILDEANIAVFYKLFSLDDLLGLIDLKPEHVELVITGRKADPKLIERADLATEMRQIKHYYEQGVPARKGIEM